MYSEGKQNMAKSQNVKEVVNQVAIEVAVAVMMALGDAGAGHWLTTAASHREPWRQRHNGPVLVKPAFN